MNGLLRYQKSILILILSTLMLTLLTIHAPQTRAASIGERIRNLFTRERKEGSPSGRSRGGAVRDESCISPTGEPLTALIPENNLGTTVAARPTFWFYIPSIRSETDIQARFVMLDENQRPVLDPLIETGLPDTSGIVSLKLPETEQALEVGKRYKWYFQVLCDQSEPSRNPWVSGWVERVEASPELVRQLETLPESEQYLAFVEHGISQEALTQLARHRSVYADDWQNLLEYFGLEDVADVAIGQLDPLVETRP